ncbi:MAG: hypothetical protein NVSMB14_06180 [Isosphaeraceae bacterium]
MADFTPRIADRKPAVARLTLEPHANIAAYRYGNFSRTPRKVLGKFRMLDHSTFSVFVDLADSFAVPTAPTSALQTVERLRPISGGSWYL